MVETREQPPKDEKKDFKIHMRKRWFVFFAVLFVAIPLVCWTLVKYAVEPVLEKQEINLGAPEITYGIKPMEIVLEQSPHLTTRWEMILELNNTRASKELRVKEPRIIEIIYDIVALENSEAIVTVAGRHKLKRNLINRLNDELKSGKVIQIYVVKFTFAKEPIPL